MRVREEWAINRKGEVMLALAAGLPGEPLDAHVTATGRIVLRMEGGGHETFTPNRKVASALRRQERLLVAETGADGVPRGRWVPKRTADRPSAAPSFR